MPAETSMSVPCETASAARVRHRMSAELLAAGLRPDVIEDAALIATELIANAVLHGGPTASGMIRVRWEVSGSAVTVRVTDGGGPGRPSIRRPTPDQTSGRGLSIVNALASRWGVEDAADSTTVWASLRA